MTTSSIKRSAAGVVVLAGLWLGGCSSHSNSLLSVVSAVDGVTPSSPFCAQAVTSLKGVAATETNPSTKNLQVNPSKPEAVAMGPVVANDVQTLVAAVGPLVPVSPSDIRPYVQQILTSFEIAKADVSSAEDSSSYGQISTAQQVERDFAQAASAKRTVSAYVENHCHLRVPGL